MTTGTNPGIPAISFGVGMFESVIPADQLRSKHLRGPQHVMRHLPILASGLAMENAFADGIGATDKDVAEERRSARRFAASRSAPQ